MNPLTQHTANPEHAGPAADPDPGHPSGQPAFALPDRLLRELGGTGGGPEVLALLIRDQHTRRLLRLRALLDAAAAAPAAVCPPASLDRLRADWSVLEAAERADRPAVRDLLLGPLTGPWVQRCLHGLTGPTPTDELTLDLDHFGAIAVAAAIRAALPLTTTLAAHGPLLVLPSVGALRVHPGAPVDVSVSADGVTFRQGVTRPVTVRRTPEGTLCDDARWIRLRALPALVPGGRPVVLDDLDPYRTAGSGLVRHGLGAVTRIGDADRAAWAASWSGTEPVLRVGGAHRTTEAALLLRCLVPLSPPPGHGPVGEGASHCSGTRREAFGAVLCSRPSTPAYFAATLVHELQHTKLAALSTLTPLHHEDPNRTYFAPWRADPRPFDGLLQGTYSHLALADHWQCFALAATDTTQRDLAWAEHARCREQVGAVLPVLDASDALTAAGRVVVNGMALRHHHITRQRPPAGHTARARAYVRTARAIWTQRHHTVAPEE